MNTVLDRPNGILAATSCLLTADDGTGTPVCSVETSRISASYHTDQPLSPYMVKMQFGTVCIIGNCYTRKARDPPKIYPICIIFPLGWPVDIPTSVSVYQVELW